jgi:POT family proton-dependent oligopeptide transporter
MTQSAKASAVPLEGGFFGHPRGLATLFFTEMWERFSYYGMRGILILFMVDAIQTGGLGLTVGRAAAIYGLYTAAAYLTALPGGWIADRIVGARNAVFYGGILIAAGQLTLAFSSTTQAGFYGGLLMVVTGTGLLKPNVSAIVGDLYPDGGARRDAGFSVFYMGINIGAFVGPLVCGYLGEQIAWKYAFLAAGIGMIAGLIQYKVGAGLGELGGRPTPTAEEKGSTNKTLGTVAAVIVGVVAILYFLNSSGIFTFTLEQAAGATGVLIFGLVVVYFAVALLFGGFTSLEKKRLVVIFFLFLGAALFWSGFEQAGSALNLFAADYTDRVMLGWEVPASWLQSVNPIFIIIFAPVFGWLWLALGKWNPSLPFKFGYGLILLGLGFLVMAWAAVYASPTEGVSPMWLVVTYFLHTSGELCLSPIGLSNITKLSPKKLVGQMMGIWFMGASLGNLIAGLAAGQMENMPLTRLFGTVAAVVIGSGILFVLFKGPIHRLQGGVE